VSAQVVPIVVVALWGEPGDTTSWPTGEVTFDLTEDIQQPEAIVAKTVRCVPAFGTFAQQLAANDKDSTGESLFPATTQYRVTENLLGAPEQDYYITVPAVPPGSRSVSDGVTTEGMQTLTSASADFTDDDLNAYVLLPQFPAGTQISVVLSSSAVTLSTAASASATGVEVLIGASVSLQSLRPQIV
jgi:hypothetical protein